MTIFFKMNCSKLKTNAAGNGKKLIDFLINDFDKNWSFVWEQFPFYLCPAFYASRNQGRGRPMRSMCVILFAVSNFFSQEFFPR